MIFTSGIFKYTSVILIFPCLNYLFISIVIDEKDAMFSAWHRVHFYDKVANSNIIWQNFTFDNICCEC